MAFWDNMSLDQILYNIPVVGSIMGNPYQDDMQAAFDKANASLEALKSSSRDQRQDALKRGFEFRGPAHQYMQMLFPGMFPDAATYYGNLPGDQGYGQNTGEGGWGKVGDAYGNIKKLAADERAKQGQGASPGGSEFLSKLIGNTKSIYASTPPPPRQLLPSTAEDLDPPRFGAQPTGFGNQPPPRTVFG